MNAEDQTELAEALGDGLKTITSAAIGSFPVVGGPISALLNKLWAQNDEAKKAQALRDMEQRIDAYIDQKLDAATLADVQSEVRGYLDLAAKFDTDTGHDKVASYDSLINQGVSKIPSIYRTDRNGNPDGPERFYTYFLLFASAHLIMLHHQAFNYKTCTGLDPTDQQDESHIQDLFRHQNEHVLKVSYMKDRLLTWRKNNISDSVGEKTVTYDRGPELGMDSYKIFEWHDTINGVKWSDSNPLNADKEQQIRESGEEILRAYRASMLDETEKTFDHDGQTIDSFGYSLARELDAVQRWQYYCCPEGGSRWKAEKISYDQAKDSVLLHWHFQADQNSAKYEGQVALDELIGLADDDPPEDDAPSDGQVHQHLIWLEDGEGTEIFGKSSAFEYIGLNNDGPSSPYLFWKDKSNTMLPLAERLVFCRNKLVRTAGPAKWY